MQKSMSKSRILLASLMLLVLMGAGCAAEKKADKKPEPAAKKVVELKVGVMVPLSGDVASYGESVKKAAQLAHKDLKASNVKLVFEDSKCSGKDAVSSINKLITVDKVSAIVGELCSGATLAAAPVAEKNKVVMVSPASTNEKVSDAGEYIFRTIPSDALQGDFGAKLAYKKGYKKMAVVYTNEDYGKGFDKVLKEAFPKLGGKVVTSEAVERGAVDVKAQLTKVKAANPDVIYMISNSPKTAVAMLKQLKELGIKVPVLASEGLKSKDVLGGAKTAAEGMLVAVPSGGTKAYVDAYKTEYDADLGPFSAQSYDAMMVIVKAVQAGATNGEEIKNKLYSMEFDGVTGEVKFDKKGDVGGNYDLFVVKDGKFELSK